MNSSPAPTLFDPIPSDDSIDARFARFDAEHPEVYALFKRFALELLAAGRTRYSADAICHRIRWEWAVNQDRRRGERKINDHYPSRYARKLRDEDERFADFFEFRKLRRATV